MTWTCEANHEICPHNVLHSTKVRTQNAWVNFDVLSFGRRRHFFYDVSQRKKANYASKMDGCQVMQENVLTNHVALWQCRHIASNPLFDHVVYESVNPLVIAS